MTSTSKYKQLIPSFIIDYENDMSLKEIAKKYNCSVGTVHRFLKSRVQMRPAKTAEKYKNNYTNFDHLTKESAYWLGFLAADAYIRSREDLRQHYVRIKLSDKDIDHLIKFKNFMKIEKEIKYDKGYPLLTYNSKHMVKSISKYIAVNKKSLNLSLPNIDKSLIGHFLRGYFDGDGWANNSKGKCIGIVGLGPIIKNLYDLFQNNGITCYLVEDKRSNAASVRIYKKESFKIFYELLNGNSSLRLERKWKVIEEYIK